MTEWYSVLGSSCQQQRYETEYCVCFLSARTTLEKEKTCVCSFSPNTYHTYESENAFVSQRVPHLTMEKREREKEREREREKEIEIDIYGER